MSIRCRSPSPRRVRLGASPRRCDEPAASPGRVYHAMIAAVAIANGLTVYTCHPDDFSEIDGLEVVAVPHPQGAHSD